MVDANLLLRQFLLNQPTVTTLLGTNQNGSIYCGYDLPEHFDPTLGPAIQIFRTGGRSHVEITAMVDARMHIRVWAGVEYALLASQVYGAIHDVLHGACDVGLPASGGFPGGTIVRALEATGPLEMTDPETGWIAVYAFYTVLATGAIGPAAYVPQFYEGDGAPVALHNNEDVYYDESTGNVWEQVAGAWLLLGNVGSGGAMSASSIYHAVAAAGTNPVNIKPAAGLVTGGEISNDTEYQVYVKLFNKATAPVPGTDTPVQTIGCQAGEHVPIDVPDGGLTYSNGIGIAITKGIADLDATAVAAGDCVVDIFYQ